MRRAIGLLTILILALELVTSAEATVLTFDDLSGTGLLADGYGGITWNGEWAYYDSAQPPYNPKSNFERIYNVSQSSPTEFSFASPTVFDGAWFSGYGENFISGGQNLIHFDLYDGATLVWTSGTLLPSDIPSFLASGYGGLVTRVAVSSASGDYYVMDDVTFNSSAVPEPASLSLLGLGLASAGVPRWRQRRCT